MLVVFLVSFFLSAFAQDESCGLNSDPTVNELAGQACRVSENALSDEPETIASDRDKREFSKKIQNSFDELKKESEADIEQYKAAIVKLEEQIKNKQDQIKSAPASEKQNLEYQLGQLQTRLETKKRNLEKSQNILDNLTQRFDAVADLVVKKGCKNLLQNVSITTGGKVIKKGVNGQAGTPILGEFTSEDAAEAFKVQLLSENPHYTNCHIKKTSASELVQIPQSHSMARTLDKIAGAGDSFIDNGKGLAATSVARLDDEINGANGWKQKLLTTQDELGRKIERKLTKIKIYTCASTYRNCSPLMADKRTPEQDGCGNLDLLRAYSDEDILKALNGNSGHIKEKSLLSAADTASLTSVLRSPHYKKALQQLGADQSTPDGREKRLWIALSSMRADNMANKIREEMGEYAKDAEFEIIPTGHPNDPFNNSKIDPALTGTCGPLPDTQDSYYGQCLSKMCSLEKPLCNKLKTYYESPEVLAAREKMLKDRGIDPAKASAQERYAAHRYYQIEPEMVETTKETKESKLQVERFQVSCGQLKLHCKKIDITPEFDLPRLGITSTQGSVINTKGSSGGSCPAW